MSFEEKIRVTFAGQKLLALMGAQLVRVTAGEVDIALPFRADLGQQSGSLHAGTIAAIADTACGLASLTLMDATSDVVSVEFKVNLLAPAIGSRFLARGRVVRAGRTITFCEGEVLADDEKVVATITATMMQRRSQGTGHR
jgi:uncharacterized protein (TIGR00369 family)